MQFSSYTQAVVGLALLTIGLVALAAIGGAATTEMANESATFDSSENVTIEVAWNDSASTGSTADVSIYDETTWQADGTEVGNYSGTLNGTVLEVEDSILPNATYTAELNQSEAGTVTVSSSAFDNGSVDLSTQTSQNITSDDDVLSLTISAETVVTDSISADPGNTTTTEYNASDGLVDGDEYRVLVEADDTEADEVTVSASSGFLGGAIFGSDGTAGFGAGVAIAAIAAIAAVGAIARRE